MAIQDDLARELRGDVRADDYTRHLYAADASLYANAPLLVAFPRDAADVAAAIRFAAARAASRSSPRGAGTSLAGQTAGQGIVLDTSRHMDAIGEIDLERRRVRVGPGVVQDDLNRAVMPPRARLRPRHLDLQPGHARRHDRQQLVGQPLDRLRHHDRPRPRARRRALRRLDRHARAGRARTSAPAAPRPTRSRARSTAGCRRSCASTPARSPRTTRATGASPAATGSTTSRASSTSPASSPAARAASSRSPRPRSA